MVGLVTVGDTGYRIPGTRRQRSYITLDLYFRSEFQRAETVTDVDRWCDDRGLQDTLEAEFGGVTGVCAFTVLSLVCTLFFQFSV